MDASVYSRRTFLQRASGVCFVVLSLAQSGCASNAKRDVNMAHESGGAHGDGNVDSAKHTERVTGALSVAQLPQGKELWSEAVADGGGQRFAQPSRPLISNGTVYVSGRGEMSARRLKDGELLVKAQLEDMGYSGARTALAEGLILAVYGDGSLAAFDSDDLSLVWRQRYDFAKGIRETGSGTHEDGTSYSISEEFDADWYATDITVCEDAAVVGFSSYQTNPGSYLLCIELSSGEVRWQQEYQGRFCYFAGVSHPCATAAGVLAPVPEEPRLQLLDCGDGHVLGELATDAFVGMGFSIVPGTEDEYLTVTRSGCFLHLHVSSAGIERRASRVLPGPDGVERVLMPSCAQPIVVGDVVVCNLPVPSEMRNDGFEVPKEGVTGGFASFALDASGFISYRSSSSFDATPVVLQAQDETVPYLYYLQDDGLYRMSFSDGKPSDPELLNEGVSLGLDTQRGPFALDENGYLALVCGNVNLQRLHVLR